MAFLKNILALLFGMGGAILLLLITDRFLAERSSHFELSSSEAAWEVPLEIAAVPISAFDQKHILEILDSTKSRYSAITGSETEHHVEIKKPSGEFELISATEQSNTGATVYDVTYTLDQRGRRIGANRKIVKSDTAVIFLGCSVTFGTGLEDNETYPFYFSTLADNVQVWNLASPGAGVNDIYQDFVEKKNLKFDIPAKKIIVVYGSLIAHPERMTCSTRCLSENFWARNKPHYVLENGLIVNAGKHSDFYGPSLVNDFLRNFKSLTVGPLVFPTLYDDNAANLHYALLTAIKKELEKKYTVIDFYQLYMSQSFNKYVNFMESRNSDHTFKPIVPPLRELQSYLSGPGHYFSIPLDAHPAPATNFMLAEALSYQLKKDHPEIFSKNSVDRAASN